MNKLILTIVGFSFFTHVLSQEKHYDLVTDRPDQTESSSTVPKGGLQIETGFLFENDEDEFVIDQTTTFNTSLLRYGLLDNLEFRFGFENLKNDLTKKVIDTKYTKQGFAPLLLGTKIAISKQKGILPEMALLSHLVLPNTGNEDLEQELMTPEMILSMSWGINDMISTGINVGSAWSYNTKSFAYPEGFYSWVIGIGINDKLGAFIETFGNFQRNEDIINNLDGGFTYLILPNLQFDVSGGFGVTNAATDYFMSTGLSILLVN